MAVYCIAEKTFEKEVNGPLGLLFVVPSFYFNLGAGVAAEGAGLVGGRLGQKLYSRLYKKIITMTFKSKLLENAVLQRVIMKILKKKI